jgi:hypothetical protein
MFITTKNGTFRVGEVVESSGNGGFYYKIKSINEDGTTDYYSLYRSTMEKVSGTIHRDGDPSVWRKRCDTI